MKYQAVLGFVALTLAVACGSTDKPPGLATELGTGGTGGTSVTHTGGKGGSGGKGGGGGRVGGGGDTSDGGDGGPGVVVGGPLAPIVTITSPVAVTDPSGPVIINDSAKVVDVTCKAVAANAPGAEGVVPTSVTIEMIDDTGGSTIQPAATTANADEYSTEFIVSQVKNGALSFTCRARDQAGHEGSAKVQTFIDHGPDITRNLPVADSPHPSGAMTVDFTVTPSPLAPGDPGADVTTVKLEINGKPIDLSKAADAGKPGHYQLDVDLTTQNPLFPTQLKGPIVIVITATDKRNATQSDTYHFVVDGEGPSITINSPPANFIIGGKQTLQFTVTDALSGVNPDSVTVDISGSVTTYSSTTGLWTHSGDAYTFVFDTFTVQDATVQILVNARAKDLAGNPSDPASVTYNIDNKPPVVDMNPLDIRERKIVSGTKVCSDLFDPLGSATNDLAVIDSFGRFRAVAWDQTNGASGQEFALYKGVTSVVLYIQTKADRPLLIDKDPTDSNPYCNEINGKDDVSSTAALVLSPIPPAGASSFTSPEGSAISASVSCVGHSESPPLKLCTGHISDLTRVIQHEATSGADPVIYASPSVGDQCTGTQFQPQTVVKTNGWVCMATRAVDGNGNVGISAPLRICLNDPANTGTSPDCANMSTADPPPSCTDGCTPPPHFPFDVIDLPQ